MTNDKPVTKNQVWWTIIYMVAGNHMFNAGLESCPETQGLLLSLGGIAMLFAGGRVIFGRAER